MARSCVGGLALMFAVVLSLVAMPALATVSGENGRIAFVSNADGDADIYTMNPDGSGIVQVTNAPDQNGFPVQDHDPAWSPDGRSIAFTRTVTSLDGEARVIWIMDADGSDQRMIVDGSEPTWSPDGRSIAFAMGALGVVELDGSVEMLTDPVDPVGIVGETLSDYAPSWSPDGREIVFLRKLRPSDPRRTFVALMALNMSDGSTRNLLPDNGKFADRAQSIDVSPDARSVVSARQHFRVPPGQLYLFDIAAQTGSVIDAPDLLDSWTASFAPSGDRLAVTLLPGMRNLDVPPSLWTMDVDGANPQEVLADDVILSWDPVWQPVNPYPVGLVDTSQSRWHLRHTDGHVQSFYYGNPGDIPFMGDWDCDGIDTPGLYRQSDGYVYLRNTNTQGIADMTFYFGNPGDTPLAGDFNGDGCDTVSLYRPTEQRFYIINHLGDEDEGIGQAEVHYVFGNPGDTPFVGDFNGDGIDTAGLHRSTTGLVYYRNTHTQGTADNQFLFGDPADSFITNDWNGDGHDTPAVYRPSNTTHYFRFTNTQGPADAQYIWGEPHWQPLTGTFNTDPGRP